MQILRQKSFGWFSKGDSGDKVKLELGEDNYNRIESLRKNLDQLGDFPDYVKKVDRVTYDCLYDLDCDQLIYYVPYPVIWLDKTIFSNKLNKLSIDKNGIISILDICDCFGDDFETRNRLGYNINTHKFVLEGSGSGDSLSWVSNSAIKQLNSLKNYMSVTEILDTFSYNNDEDMISDMKIKQKVLKIQQLIDKYTLELVKIFKKL